MRGEHDIGATVGLAVMGLYQLLRRRDRLLPNALVVAPGPLVHAREVDVVKASAGPYPEAELGHCRQRDVRVHVAVDHGRRAEGHGLERAEAGERHSVFLADIVTVGHALCVGGRKTHIERDPPHQRQHGVRMNVDVPRSDDPSGKVHLPPGGPLHPIARTNPCDLVCHNAHDAILDDGRLRIVRH